MAFSSSASRINFYPRPPRGGRLSALVYTFRLFAFLSTPSARRATISLFV